MNGPDTRYMMQWCGKWRPVLNMIDANSVPTTLVLRATRAVLWCDDPPTANGWVAVVCHPGEIAERFDRDLKKRQWDAL
jgi:hypothetical protein